MKHLLLYLQFLLYHQLFRVVWTSYGDYEPNYQQCYQKCIRQCRKDSNYLHELTYPPFNSTTWIPWDCIDRCHYVCMNKITMIRLAEKKEVYKYFGHWPFLRWFGMEEPASAIFSLFNAIPHLYWLFAGRLQVRGQGKWYMYPWLVLYAAVAINAWIASTIFHMRKESFSIFYDYTSALFVLITGFWLIIRRIGGKIFPVIVQLPILLSLYGYASYRVYTMYYYPHVISFTKHLHFCIGTAAITTIFWLYWISTGIIWKGNTMRLSAAKWYALIIQIWFVIASLFEVFDFPPIWRTFDAHSCWHGLTIPLGFIFYQFWIIDYSEEMTVSSGSTASDQIREKAK